jgi:hypothetical protein
LFVQSIKHAMAASRRETMKVRTIASRTLLASLAVVSSGAMTSPAAWASSKPGNGLKLCLKILKPHCIGL